MPKFTYERGTKSTPFKKEQRGRKGGDKGAIRGSQSPTNLDTDNHKPISGDGTLGVLSVNRGQSNTEVSKSLADKYQYQKDNSMVAKDHVKWPEFAAWCRSKRDKHGYPGTPTEEGFWKWLCGQNPKWRNKVKERTEENGYVLHGKWLTTDEANHLGRENHELLTKFRRAVKRDGKIIVSENSITGTGMNPQVDLLGVPMAQEEKEKRLGFVPIKELVAEVRKVFPNAQLISKSFRTKMTTV